MLDGIKPFLHEAIDINYPVNIQQKANGTSALNSSKTNVNGDVKYGNDVINTTKAEVTTSNAVNIAKSVDNISASVRLPVRDIEMNIMRADSQRGSAGFVTVENSDQLMPLQLRAKNHNSMQWHFIFNNTTILQKYLLDDIRYEGGEVETGIGPLHGGWKQSAENHQDRKQPWVETGSHDIVRTYSPKRRLESQYGHPQPVSNEWGYIILQSGVFVQSPQDVQRMHLEKRINKYMKDLSDLHKASIGQLKCPSMFRLQQQTCESSYLFKIEKLPSSSCRGSAEVSWPRMSEISFTVRQQHTVRYSGINMTVSWLRATLSASMIPKEDSYSGIYVTILWLWATLSTSKVASFDRCVIHKSHGKHTVSNSASLSHDFRPHSPHPYTKRGQVCNTQETLLTDIHCQFSMNATFAWLLATQSTSKVPSDSVGTFPSGEELQTTGDTMADICIYRLMNFFSSCLQADKYSSGIVLKQMNTVSPVRLPPSFPPPDGCIYCKRMSLARGCWVSTENRYAPVVLSWVGHFGTRSGQEWVASVFNILAASCLLSSNVSVRQNSRVWMSVIRKPGKKLNPHPASLPGISTKNLRLLGINLFTSKISQFSTGSAVFWFSHRRAKASSRTCSSLQTRACSSKPTSTIPNHRLPLQHPGTSKMAYQCCQGAIFAFTRPRHIMENGTETLARDHEAGTPFLQLGLKVFPWQPWSAFRNRSIGSWMGTDRSWTVCQVGGGGSFLADTVGQLNSHQAVVHDFILLYRRLAAMEDITWFDKPPYENSSKGILRRADKEQLYQEEEKADDGSGGGGKIGGGGWWWWLRKEEEGVGGGGDGGLEEEEEGGVYVDKFMLSS
ncbi:hypothetical protein MAR_009854 [Mya arenaria]|uniref:Uncharacterized protein n=1 Tax=Mya arenaria TaxID=6604 RepID=A0ABY7E827_MYAAR|nr:hypothetical protein MAR_009854 [Mya arenaria]